MKIINRNYKCAICGEENEYRVIASNFINGYNDFDLKPVGSMAKIGSEIKECPNCHYCNYEIDKLVQHRFENCENRLELWNKYSEVTSLFSEENESLRKILILAQQYKGNMDYKKQYNLLIQASWVCEDKEQESNFRRRALDIFVKYIVPEYRNTLMQAADLFRMESAFDISEETLKCAEILIEKDEEKIMKVINKEREFIKNKDNIRHSLGEVFEQK